MILKNLLFPAFAAVVLGLSACSGNAPVSTSQYMTVHHIGDSIFALQYDDYDFDACRQYFDSQFSGESFGACSEVRKGGFVGRNMDYYVNRNALAIIKVEGKSTDNAVLRHASIGVVGCFKEFTYDRAINDTMSIGFYNILPGRTVDGINDCGVYIGVNVVPFREDLAATGSYDVPDDEGRYNALYLTRFVLDNAESVDHALALIGQHKWYFPHDYPHHGDVQPFHWMIADSEKNCVLEFENGAPVVLSACGDEINAPSVSTIMTNFSNNLWKDGILDREGIGYERWDILHDNYACDQEPSVDSMFNLMQQVWFSNAYTNSCTLEDHSDFWFSELADSSISITKLYKKGDEYIKDPADRPSIDDFINTWNDATQWFSDDTELWFTVHTSIYNLHDRQLSITPHEGRMTRDSQRPIRYQFSLDSSWK